MKKITLFLSLAFLSGFINAQDPVYSGTAKVAVKNFWESAAKLELSIRNGGSAMDGAKLASLTNLINSAKQKDASYNTSSMNEKLKLLTEAFESLKKEKEIKLQDSRNKATASDEKNKRVYELLGLLFNAVIGDHTADNIQAKIGSYKEYTRELLAMDRSENKSELARFLARLKTHAADAGSFYPGLEKSMKEKTDAKLAEVGYYMFQYYQAYWDAAQKIYPGEADLGKSYALVTAILERMGSVDNVLALAAKNNEQKIKDTRLPEATSNDNALEKLFMDAFNKMYSGAFKGNALKAVITSGDWTIQRNQGTGIVTSRLRRGAIVYKSSDGQCYLIKEFFIQQEHVGNSFVGTKSVYAVGRGQEMLCENVK